MGQSTSQLEAKSSPIEQQSTKEPNSNVVSDEAVVTRGNNRIFQDVNKSESHVEHASHDPKIRKRKQKRKRRMSSTSTLPSSSGNAPPKTVTFLNASDGAQTHPELLDTELEAAEATGVATSLSQEGMQAALMPISKPWTDESPTHVEITRNRNKRRKLSKPNQKKAQGEPFIYDINSDIEKILEKSATMSDSCTSGTDSDSQNAIDDNSGLSSDEEEVAASNISQIASTSNCSPDSLPNDGPVPKRRVMFQANEVKNIQRVLNKFGQKQALEKEQVIKLLHQPMTGKTERLWWRLYDVVPRRSTKDIRRFCRKRWPEFEKTSAWTAEDDEKLRSAYEKHPGRWTLIAPLLGKRREDCRNRWRNHVKYGNDKTNTFWEPHEEKKMLKIVKSLVRKIVQAKVEWDKSKGITPTEDDKFDPRDYIDWNVVSERMDGKRSRQQCAQKFARMRRNFTQAPATTQVTPKPDARGSATHLKTTRKSRERTSARRQAVDSPEAPSNHPDQTESSIEGAEVAAKMLHGDYYELLRVITRFEPEDEAKIPWSHVQLRIGNDGVSIKARKAALKKALGHVEPRETFMETLLALKEHLEETYPDTVHVRWKPAKRLQDQGMELSEVIETLREVFVRF